MTVLAGSNASGSGDATISAVDGAAITPSDSVVIQTTRSIYVGVTGNLTLTMLSGNVVTFPNVPVGIFPAQATKIMATGTTASGIVAMY